MHTSIINFDDMKDKQVLWNCLKSCKGKWRVELTRYRPRRSDAQNRYYWAVVVPMFADFLREQGEQYTNEDAHEVLKAAWLRKSIHKPDGELLCESIGSTAKLTTSEFIDYIDRCVVWLADMFHIVVPNPGEYRVREPETRNAE